MFRLLIRSQSTITAFKWVGGLKIVVAPSPSLIDYVSYAFLGVAIPGFVFFIFKGISYAEGLGDDGGDEVGGCDGGEVGEASPLDLEGVGDAACGEGEKVDDAEEEPGVQRRD